MRVSEVKSVGLVDIMSQLEVSSILYDATWLEMLLARNTEAERSACPPPGTAPPSHTTQYDNSNLE